MVWVWPPHTSMNLNRPPSARVVIRSSRARAAAGSRYSSTNLISLPSAQGQAVNARGSDGVDLVGIGLPHQLQALEGPLGLFLIDLRHGEADVDQHPVAHNQRL